MREAVGPEFIIMYRLSMLDLVPAGSSWEEVLALAQAVEAAGASLINTGIGWHEARVPTIATKVPRAGFTWVTRKLKQSGAVSLPLVTTNRINMPEVRRARRAGRAGRAGRAPAAVPRAPPPERRARRATPRTRRPPRRAQTAEAVLARGDADLVSMARPFLADPALLSKAEAGRSAEINTCIGCNQACLDHTFQVGAAARGAGAPRGQSGGRLRSRRSGEERARGRGRAEGAARARNRGAQRRTRARACCC